MRQITDAVLPHWVPIHVFLTPAGQGMGAVGIERGRGGWVVVVERGGMRRKRHQTRSKIINRLSAEHQVK